MLRELVERARRGDEVAFAALLDETSNKLFAVAYRILRDVDQADDAVQETYVAAWRALPTLRDPDRFEAWLYRLLVRTCYREARRRRWTVDVDALPETATGTANPGDAIATRDQLERGFRRLSPEHRAVLVLYHYVGLQLAEIGDVLGIPPGTAASRLHYASRALRAAVESDARASAGILRGPHA